LSHSAGWTLAKSEGLGWFSVADPVRLHVAAKRYLCTIDLTYKARLSPTSLKSYLDQGGPMDANGVFIRP
jgi:predicted HD phosphohydrolase